WYDQMNSGDACARCTDVATLRSAGKADQLPIVIGELYAGPDVDALQRLNDFRAKGFSGAWGWSLFYDKTSDGKHLDLNAYQTLTTGPSSTPVPGTESDAAPKIELQKDWVSPTYLEAGQAITFYQDIASDRDTDLRLVFDVVDDQGNGVLQSVLDNQSI